ncbi:MAG: hypothetical protein EPO21_06530 [Chloroflexota bacterium]|nr:MAG: hypothetical protein EPO21_06530 [Chloroflexota bacterium]
METMTSQERMAAVAQGKRPDRVPVLAMSGGYAARLYGLSLKEFYTNPEKSFKVQRLVAELHGYDESPSYGWADTGAWEFGGGIRFPESDEEGAPVSISDLVTKPSDVDRLEIPDPRTAGMYPALLEFNRLSRAHGLPARIPAGSATTAVGAIIGRERLLRWYYKEPEAVRVVYDKVTRFLLRAADVMIEEFGAENCTAGLGAPNDSNELISSKIFESFSVPYLKVVIEGLVERGINRFSAHICGDHHQNLAAWTALPLPPRSSISIGSQMDIVEVAEAFNHKHIISGNVPTWVLHLGTYDEVNDAARQCIEQGKDLPGGYILMPACGLPVQTPPLNVHALVAAARHFGSYN